MAGWPRSGERGLAQISLSARQFLLVRGAVLVVVLSMAGWLVGAVLAADGPTAVDLRIWTWMVAHRSGPLTSGFTVITYLGGAVGMTVLASVVALVLLLRPGRRGDGILVAVVSIGAGLLVAVSKPLVGRVRPPSAFRLVTETNASFPSAHALSSAAVIGVVAVVLSRASTRHAVRVAIASAAVGSILLIGVSRLYLGVHWATDILGGWLVGAGWLLLCLTIYDLRVRVPTTG